MNDMSPQPRADQDADPYLRLRDVRDQVRLGRSTIYRRIAAGTFPQPYDLGGNCSGWKQSEIAEWKRTRPRRSRQ